MDIGSFRTSLTGDAPPSPLQPPLVALWWAAKGDWDKAHKVAQEQDDPTGAWVHAYLHRVEGDLDNAGYWYRRARRPAATDSLDSEWATIVGALLAEGGATPA